MAIRSAILVLAAAAASMPAIAAEPVVLSTGEAVEMSIRRDGEIVVRERGRARLSAFDEASLRHLLRNHPDATGPNAVPLGKDDGLPEPERVKSGRVRIKFVEFPPGDSALVLENGYARALVYRARIRSGDQSAPTDVCLVMPGKRGFEHWPYRIDSIELSRLRLEKWKPRDGIRCE